MAENLEKIRSTELCGAALEGSTIFLNRSSTCRVSMESCRLAELKYAILSGTGRKTKKLRCSKLFLSMVSKHAFLFQYSSITRTPLESSRLAEFECEIFTRIGRKTKKLQLSKNPAQRQWPGTTHKKV